MAHIYMWEATPEQKVRGNELFTRVENGDKSVLGVADVFDYVDTDGCTPLHWAADKGWVEVLNHPDVAKRVAMPESNDDTDGRTPLHLLARRLFLPSRRMYNLLHEHPGFTTLEDANGYTPRDVVLEEVCSFIEAVEDDIQEH